MGLARAVTRRRSELGWSTRDLARRAGISQPYVVALERSRSTAHGAAPTPTVDVVARIAHALGLDPVALFTAGLRPVGRHVLLVAEDHERSPLQHARAAASTDVDTWVCAGDGDARDGRSIQLRSDRAEAYRPAVIADALAREMRGIRADVDGRNIGVLFGETSAVMSSIDDPRTVIDFEHSWSRVVGDAVAAVGAHAACNVCVYQLADLQALDDPIDVVVDLMRSHDTVWAARGARVVRGERGARRILDRLRPRTVQPSAWRSTSDQLLADLAISA